MRRGLGTLCLVLAAYGAFAQSLTLTGGVNNVMFDSADAASNPQTPHPMASVNAGIDGNFTTFSRYHLAFTIDPILQSFLSGNVTFNLWIFKLGIGSFLAVFNEGEQENVPGMTGSLGIEAAGVFSASIEYGLNAFTDLTKTGNTNLNFGNIEALLWLPNVLVHLTMQRKSFIQARSKDYTAQNSSLCYRGALDIFSKSSPVVLTIGAERRTIERIIEPIGEAQIAKQENSIDGVFFIAGLTLELRPGFDLILKAEGPLSISVPGIFFIAEAGFKIKLGEN
jgi:hypothetical protein